MWKCVDEAVVGLSHVKNNIPCQDKTYSSYKNGVYTIALADGAGSCKASDVGASLVTQKISEYLSEHFDKFFESSDENSVKVELTTFLLEELTKKANELNVQMNDLSSTLLFVALKDNQYIIGHIGDGIIAGLDKLGLLVFSRPTNGEYLNTTYFITSNAVVDRFKLIRSECEDVYGFILMSDGSAESLYDRAKQTLGQGCETMMRWLVDYPKEDVKMALKDNLEKIIRKKTSDDCSIALLVKGKDLEHLELKKLLKRRYEGVITLHQLELKSKILEIVLKKPLPLEGIKRYFYIKKRVIKRMLTELIEKELLTVSNGFYQIHPSFYNDL